MEVDVGPRQRTLMTLWFGILMSVVMYFVLSLVVSREVSSDAQTESSSVLIVALTALALVLIIISFAVKRRFLVQSVDRQDITLVQRGYLFAWVFCEVTALVGLLLGLR